ncbi:phosphate acyltransferase PlsX [Pikeienuella piscinae]|uniref:Phosphate acyltransferase n=1 Tax=Pikeienuella piscinae TaxID=2748098 RepID=A0A7L5BVQ9_9RHOB|nr:phosphate acyltransferase PlsX [Pikeienuella piscinae]QIE55193.1 phosphate acyltransferase PlsX [Pikeienuella piscinae]
MSEQTVISVDTTGGDRGPGTILAGLNKAVRQNPAARFILHGDAAEMERLLRRRAALRSACDLRHAEGVVPMDAKPSYVIRHANGTSMLGALDSVRSGEAQVAVSCGNTGALMALAMLRLRTAPGVDRPAIAVTWPSHAPHGYNIVLDVGADVRADARSMVEFAVMGAEYARLSFNLARPRVGVLNVGSEDHKGRPGIREAANLIAEIGPQAGEFEYVGFVEGGDIVSDRVDVIVTDGFTGNIALKTAEGAARLIHHAMRDAFTKTVLSRAAALLAYGSLRRLQKRIDPRRVNGGVFLGLGGAVVKSHGSADATGVAAAVKLAFRMGESGFSQRVADRMALLPEGRRAIAAGQQDGA